jgi:transposase, IS5 family
MNGYTYEELAFHLEDSLAYRWFCRIGIGERVPSSSTLQANVARLRPETWERIHRAVIMDANDPAIEKGDKMRVDCTVTETDIHEPWDSRQLWDTIRVLTRLLKRARDAGFQFRFHDRGRAGKR